MRLSPIGFTESASIDNSRGRRSGQVGQSLVELAVTLPVLLLLVLGATDVGRLFNAQVSLNGAAHTGAIFGSANAANAGNSAAIRTAALSDTTSLPGASPAVTSTTGTDPYGFQAVTVTVTYRFDPLFPYPGLPNNVNMSKSVQMRVRP